MAKKFRLFGTDADRADHKTRPEDERAEAAIATGAGRLLEAEELHRRLEARIASVGVADEQRLAVLVTDIENLAAPFLNNPLVDANARDALAKLIDDARKLKTRHKRSAGSFLMSTDGGATNYEGVPDESELADELGNLESGAEDTVGSAMARLTAYAKLKRRRSQLLEKAWRRANGLRDTELDGDLGIDQLVRRSA